MIDRRRLLKLASACALAGLASGAGRALAAPPAKLLLVHGRGQQGLDPEALRSTWIGALNRGGVALGRTLPPDLDVAFPFYGDVLVLPGGPP